MDKEKANISNEAETDAGKVYAQEGPKINFIEMCIPVKSEFTFYNNGLIAKDINKKRVRFHV